MIQTQIKLSIKCPTKTCLKKHIFLIFLLKKKTQLNLLLPKPNKNIFLDSPFHYKTVKTHVYIPEIFLEFIYYNSTPTTLLLVLPGTAAKTTVKLNCFVKI
jgi:hypothetical protein